MEWVTESGGTLKPHVLKIPLGIFVCAGAVLSASGATTGAIGLAPNRVADSLPFAALIGLIALGAILVLRKMIRDLF
jgi:hypothetical protein